MPLYPNNDQIYNQAIQQEQSGLFNELPSTSLMRGLKNTTIDTSFLNPFKNPVATFTTSAMIWRMGTTAANPRYGLSLEHGVPILGRGAPLGFKSILAGGGGFPSSIAGAVLGGTLAAAQGNNVGGGALGGALVGAMLFNKSGVGGVAGFMEKVLGMKAGAMKLRDYARGIGFLGSGPVSGSLARIGTNNPLLALLQGGKNTIARAAPYEGSAFGFFNKLMQRHIASPGKVFGNEIAKGIASGTQFSTAAGTKAAMDAVGKYINNKLEGVSSAKFARAVRKEMKGTGGVRSFMDQFANTTGLDFEEVFPTLTEKNLTRWAKGSERAGGRQVRDWTTAWKESEKGSATKRISIRRAEGARERALDTVDRRVARFQNRYVHGKPLGREWMGYDDLRRREFDPEEMVYRARHPYRGEVERFRRTARREEGITSGRMSSYGMRKAREELTALRKQATYYRGRAKMNPQAVLKAALYKGETAVMAGMTALGAFADEYLKPRGFLGLGGTFNDNEMIEAQIRLSSIKSQMVKEGMAGYRSGALSARRLRPFTKAQEKKLFNTQLMEKAILKRGESVSLGVLAGQRFLSQMTTLGYIGLAVRGTVALGRGALGFVSNAAATLSTKLSRMTSVQFGTGTAFESEMANTERVRSLQAISNSGLNARQYLGREAELMAT